MTATPSSIRCDPGDVVLVNFRFTDQSGVKRRPAVVVSVDAYHQSRADAVIVALSTQMGATYFGDCDLIEWQAAGLPRATKAKGVIETVSRRVVHRQMGALTPEDFQRVQRSVLDIMGLP